jgi:hypothetical protein
MQSTTSWSISSEPVESVANEAFSSHPSTVFIPYLSAPMPSDLTLPDGAVRYPATSGKDAPSCGFPASWGCLAPASAIWDCYTTVIKGNADMRQKPPNSGLIAFVSTSEASVSGCPFAGVGISADVASATWARPFRKSVCADGSVCAKRRRVAKKADALSGSGLLIGVVACRVANAYPPSVDATGDPGVLFLYSRFELVAGTASTWTPRILI